MMVVMMVVVAVALVVMVVVVVVALVVVMVPSSLSTQAVESASPIDKGPWCKARGCTPVSPL